MVESRLVYMCQDWSMALVGHGMSQDLEHLAKWGVNVPEGVDESRLV